MGQETPHFEETSPIWDYSVALWLESSREGRRLALLEGFCFSTPGPFTLAGSGGQFITPAAQGSLLLAKGPRPVFVKTLYTLSVLAQTHLPKFLETSLDKVRERYDQS